MIRPADFLCIISFIMRKGAAAFFPLHLNVKIWVSTSHKQDRMSDTTGTIADITQEATRIIDAANAAGIPLRLLGGLAIYFQCPGAGSVERLQRKYNDLDFATLSKWGTKTRALFAKLGYTGNKTFNALHGHQRLFFWDEQHGRQVDIFIDRMQMCHIIDFRSRLQQDQRTLSLPDLLLTKLQIVEINEKDIFDVIALFYDHDITGPGYSSSRGWLRCPLNLYGWLLPRRGSLERERGVFRRGQPRWQLHSRYLRKRPGLLRLQAFQHWKPPQLHHPTPAAPCKHGSH